jgi:6-phosphogluconolactonase
MAWLESIYGDSTALTNAVALHVETACRQGIAEAGEAYVSLAGGRTPLPIYAHLTHAGLGGRVLAMLGDERCVEHTHAACNWRNVQTTFAAAPDIDLIPLTVESGNVADSLAHAKAVLAQHARPFDAVVLGMGEDGHFASLFPGAANLHEGLALESGVDVIATVPDPLPPEAPFPRISMTLPRLLRAKTIHLVVSGAAKRAVLQEAQSNPQAAYPITRLLHATSHPIHIHWSP